MTSANVQAVQVVDASRHISKLTASFLLDECSIHSASAAFNAVIITDKTTKGCEIIRY